MAETLEGSQVVEITEAGHIISAESPDSVTEELAEFLSPWAR